MNIRPNQPLYSYNQPPKARPNSTGENNQQGVPRQAAAQVGTGDNTIAALKMLGDLNRGFIMKELPDEEPPL